MRVIHLVSEFLERTGLNAKKETENRWMMSLDGGEVTLDGQGQHFFISAGLGSVHEGHRQMMAKNLILHLDAVKEVVTEDEKGDLVLSRRVGPLASSGELEQVLTDFVSTRDMLARIQSRPVTL